MLPGGTGPLSSCAEHKEIPQAMSAAVVRNLFISILRLWSDDFHDGAGCLQSGGRLMQAQQFLKNKPQFALGNALVFKNVACERD